MRVDAGLVLLPRFTTLVGAATFKTAPLNVAEQGASSILVWRGPIRVSSGSGTLSVTMEESLDCETWSLGASSPQAIVLAEHDRKFLSYGFQLQWFRLKFVLTGNDPIVNCWAEGLLSGGGFGMGSSGVPHGSVVIGEFEDEVLRTESKTAWPVRESAPCSSYEVATGKKTKGRCWVTKWRGSDGTLWTNPPAGYRLVDGPYGVPFDPALGFGVLEKPADFTSTAYPAFIGGGGGPGLGLGGKMLRVVEPPQIPWGP